MLGWGNGRREQARCGVSDISYRQTIRRIPVRERERERAIHPTRLRGNVHCACSYSQDGRDNRQHAALLYNPAHISAERCEAVILGEAHYGTHVNRQNQSPKPDLELKNIIRRRPALAEINASTACVQTPIRLPSTFPRQVNNAGQSLPTFTCRS